jgi:hypothetical protein
LESSLASFTRCASPSDSVVAGCPGPDVVEAHDVQRLEAALDLRDVHEGVDRLLERLAV